MGEKYFGSKITREIWGSSENIVLMYVGSAADFALNPENHWLFYTGRLPSDPQGRFISSFKYNRLIFFTPVEKIPDLAQRIRSIHTHLEDKRSGEENKEMKMSNTAFREVADMLIDYGIRGWEYLHKKQMSSEYKENYYQDMKKVQELMGVEDLPGDFDEWLEYRFESINTRLKKNPFSDKLYDAYKKDIGWFRYWVLLKFQAKFCDPVIVKKLDIKDNLVMNFLFRIYPYIPTNLDWRFAQLFFMKAEIRKTLVDFDTRSKQENTYHSHAH